MKWHNLAKFQLYIVFPMNLSKQVWKAIILSVCDQRFWHEKSPKNIRQKYLKSDFENKSNVWKNAFYTELIIIKCVSSKYMKFFNIIFFILSSSPSCELLWDLNVCQSERWFFLSPSKNSFSSSSYCFQ
jgi:hypothetical protein